MSLNPRSIATLGIGYGALPMAMLGLWSVGGAQPAVPPAPTFGMGGQRIYGGGGAARSRYKRDDELTWMGGRR